LRVVRPLENEGHDSAGTLVNVRKLAETAGEEKHTDDSFVSPGFPFPSLSGRRFVLVSAALFSLDEPPGGTGVATAAR
jgi:hypothetical protein